MAIAYLGYKVDSSQVALAEKRLDGMSGAAGVAARAAKALTVAVGAMFAGGAVIRQISDFESSMSGVAAVTRATGRELGAMRDVAKQLGSTTEFTASQAADGLRFLGMAGFEASEAIAAIPAVLDLATASGMGLADAADIASNIMSGFGIEAAKSADVADVLAAASSRANTDVSQLGRAMSTVAPISAALGISLEDTAAAIGVMSDAGIQGERAGTALRGVMAALAGPTTQAQEALAKYGLTAADVNPETRDLADIMASLQEAGLSTADAMTIFGREAASGALVLVDANRRLSEFGGELRNVDGAAADMAETMRDNLGGDIESLRSAVSGLILAMGEAGLTAVIRGVVQAVTNMVRVISQLVDGIGWVVGKIETAKNAMFGLGITSDQASRAIDNVTLAMRDELNALSVLSGSIPEGTRMSREAAQAKLDEATAIYAKIDAANAEARQIAMQSEAYRTLQREVDFLLQQAETMRDNSLAGGPFAPLAAREGLERVNELLRAAVAEQQKLLQAAEPLSDEAMQAREEIQRIQAAILAATGSQVVFNENTATGITLSERLTLALSGSAGAADGISGAMANVIRMITLAGQAAAGLGRTLSGVMSMLGGVGRRLSGLGDRVTSTVGQYLPGTLGVAGDQIVGALSGGFGEGSRLRNAGDAMVEFANAATNAANAGVEFNFAWNGATESLSGSSSGSRRGSTGGAAGALRETADAADEASDAFRDRLKSAIQSVADAFGDWISRGFKDFKQFVADVKRAFLSLLADLAKAAIMNPIRIALGIGGGAGGAAMSTGFMGNIFGGFGQGANLLGSGGLAAGFSSLAGGSGVLGGLGSTLSATFGQGGSISGLLSVGANAAAAGGGLAASIGAAIPVLGVAALAFGLFQTKVRELDNGVMGAIDGLDATIKTFRTVEKSSLFGLIKSKKTTTQETDAFDDIVGGIQNSVAEAARVMGYGSDIFDQFSYSFKLSLKGLTEEQRIEKVNAELAKMGDSMAALVPNFADMTSLITAANNAIAQTYSLGGTRFEAEMLAAARRRGEITLDRAGQGLNTTDSLIRLNNVEENTATNNRLMERLVNYIEGWQLNGVPVEAT